MNVSNFEIDAQLLEQFSSLGTDDKEDLINAFKCVVGGNVNSECCRFFLELANWNLQKGIGAYFDYSFDSPTNNPLIRSQSETAIGTASYDLVPQSSVYDARVYLSPNSDVKKESPIIWCIQNTGSSTWPKDSYIYSEIDPSNAPLISTTAESGIWAPLPADSHIFIPELPPGNFTHLVIDIFPPSADVCIQALANNVPIVGALKLCLPNGNRFGEILYCTCLPDLPCQTMVYRVGLPDMPKVANVVTSDPHETDQPMEDL